MKVFIDANAFFASASSPRGGSALVLKLGSKQVFIPVTTEYALDEAERNIKKKLSDKELSRHYDVISELGLSIQSVGVLSKENLLVLEKILPLKDIPILLGAIMSSSEFLITLDRKHFLKNKNIIDVGLSFKILTPGEFLTHIIK
jgi:predicted nucleic acid-binding protein